MLELCKQGLWDFELDGLGQFNYYEVDVFRAIEEQQSYHPVYLKLMDHIARSNAPSLNNTIRNHFIVNFLKKEENLKHVVPLLEFVDGKILVTFTRKKDPKMNRTIPLDELDETLDFKTIKNDEHKLELYCLTNYFQACMELLLALRMQPSTTLDLMIVQYYNYDVLDKAIKSLENQKKLHQIRLILSDLLDSFHNYFTLSMTKLPKQLQILDKTPEMVGIITEVSQFIEAAQYQYLGY